MIARASIAAVTGLIGAALALWADAPTWGVLVTFQVGYWGSLASTPRKGTS